MSISDVEPSILIGSTQYKTVLSAGKQTYYSVDNIRLSLVIKKDRFDEVLQVLDTLSGSLTFDGGMSNRLAGYRYWYLFGYENGSINVGVGWNTPNGKVDEAKGYIDFNPNKVLEQSKRVVDLIAPFCKEITIKRWDLAIDEFIPRKSLLLKKDGRKYQCILSNAMTEYLGQRSKPGRVKLYDKAAEQGVSGDWTRVELTCDGSWTVDEVLAKLPIVYCFDLDKNINGITGVFLVALQALVDYGESPEEYLARCDGRMKRKLKKLICDGNIVFSYSREAIKETMKWLTYYQRKLS